MKSGKMQNNCTQWVMCELSLQEQCGQVGKERRSEREEHHRGQWAGLVEHTPRAPNTMLKPRPWKCCRTSSGGEQKKRKKERKNSLCPVVCVVCEVKIQLNKQQEYFHRKNIVQVYSWLKCYTICVQRKDI